MAELVWRDDGKGTIRSNWIYGRYRIETIPTEIIEKSDGFIEIKEVKYELRCEFIYQYKDDDNDWFDLFDTLSISEICFDNMFESVDEAKSFAQEHFNSLGIFR